MVCKKEPSPPTPVEDTAAHEGSSEERRDVHQVLERVEIFGSRGQILLELVVRLVDPVEPPVVQRAVHPVE